jgi:hypothetical protein
MACCAFPHSGGKKISKGYNIMSFLPYDIRLYKRRRIHTWAHAPCILDPLFIVATCVLKLSLSNEKNEKKKSGLTKESKSTKL